MAELCNLPETVLVNRSLFIIRDNQKRLRVTCTGRILPVDQNRLLRRDFFVNESNDPFGALEPSIRDTADRFPTDIYANIFLPKKIYEALPVTYVTVGVLLILGAVYIGIGYRPMFGYLAVGLSCIAAGVTVTCIRRRGRSTSEDAVV